MEPGIYLFKEEFLKENKIPKSQWKRRQEEFDFIPVHVREWKAV